MHDRWVIGWLVWFAVLAFGGIIAPAAEPQQADRNKGLTVITSHRHYGA